MQIFPELIFAFVVLHSNCQDLRLFLWGKPDNTKFRKGLLVLNTKFKIKNWYESPLIYFISNSVITTPKIPSKILCWESLNCLDLLLLIIFHRLHFG
jgi:hypothetical protein